MREGKNIKLSASMVLAGIILFLLSGQSPKDMTETKVARNNPGKGAESLKLEAVTADELHSVRNDTDLRISI